ncbi:hypothetical protein IT072_01080 [Leifsonia sp. ZF2019]|uniref:hypothetical protein n=1 Tax=Leifsonia sp. ZF2019 TaxID=2781978 RepID=UPI001CC0CA8E|nr:hypothetical protein [Leifsonia sp. ZF2019]UAJ79724.1 hypothetical protein IT072_01080 [Leifsonia sp. ZF2019]
MTGRRGSVVFATVGIVTVALALTACDQVEFEERITSPMDHDEAKGEVESLYNEVIEVVGEGWNAPEAAWRDCRAVGEEEAWAQMSQRFGDLDATPDVLASKVAEAWRGLGYDVAVVSDSTITPPRKVVSYPAYLTGTTDDGFGAVFSVGEGYADFRGYGRCVPIDADRDDFSS